LGMGVRPTLEHQARAERNGVARGGSLTTGYARLAVRFVEREQRVRHGNAARLRLMPTTTGYCGRLGFNPVVRSA